MKKLGQRVLLAVAFGVICYVALTVYADASKLRAKLADFNYWLVVPALGLAALNYLVRFFKWHYYLKRLGVKVPPLESLLVFLAGFVLTVTPGKLGEVIKSYLLREVRGVPMARTAPIVVAERVTDLIALVLLTLVGVFTYRAGVLGILLAVGLVALFLLFIAWRRLALGLLRLLARLPLVRRTSHALEEAYESMAALVQPMPLLVATVLSTLAWFCECVGFFLIIGGFPGASASLHTATFIYASMTIAGALSFLPGGLGVTEAGMTGLLSRLGRGIDGAVAVGATFVTRVCTLWFAVLVGFVALLWLRRRTGKQLRVGD
jgi:glycosyltransferase 2 family protein